MNEPIKVEFSGLRSLKEIQAAWMAHYDEIRSLGDELHPTPKALRDLFSLGNDLLLEANLSGLSEMAQAVKKCETAGN